MTQADHTLSPEYGRSLGRGVVGALPLFILAGLQPDGGLAVQITLMAALGYLGGAVVMAARRPRTPTVADLWVLQCGFVPLWVAAQVGVRCAWSWMGRL